MSWTKKRLRDYLRQRYRAQMDALIEYMGGRCVLCGATEKLEFDHKNPATKKFTIAGLRGVGRLDEVLEELKKCRLLCHTCHLKKTRHDLSVLVKARAVSANGPDGFRHGTVYAWMTKKCTCSECYPLKRAWHDARNARRRKGPGYKRRF